MDQTITEMELHSLISALHKRHSKFYDEFSKKLYWHILCNASREEVEKAIIQYYATGGENGKEGRYLPQPIDIKRYCVTKAKKSLVTPCRHCKEREGTLSCGSELDRFLVCESCLPLVKKAQREPDWRDAMVDAGLEEGKKGCEEIKARDGKITVKAIFEYIYARKDKRESDKCAKTLVPLHKERSFKRVGQPPSKPPLPPPKCLPDMPF